ncbi:MAG: hypothetical protein ACRD2O_07585 [Terriglobia bacterium]
MIKLPTPAPSETRDGTGLVGGTEATTVTNFRQPSIHVSPCALPLATPD